MIARGCVIFVILAKCVFSIPVSPNHVDHEDVKVIKCIVEVLANALSKRHSTPVSQRCQETLLTDDRLVTILRHHNFLQELQDIAAEGANERAERRMEDGPNNESKQPKVLESIADQSMLVAMERPKVGAEKRGATENEERERESGENNEIPDQDEIIKGEEEPPSMHSDEEQDEEEDKQVMTKKRENQEEQEKAPGVEEEEDEGAGPDTPGQHSGAKKSADEEKQDEEKQDEEKMTEKRRGMEEEAELKRWSPTRQLVHTRAETSARSHHHQQETAHHSKEQHDPGEEVWKSTEEHDLRMTARRDAEDHREEEGSASKKTEDGEIEGLAAIESELESVAQKLHEMRHG